MLGHMMDRPLLISSLIEFAGRYHGDTEIVSRTVEGPIHRYGYAEARRRSKKLANALAGLGVGLGDRIATVAWNGYRHFELYFGVSGMGAILHTINPRLYPEQLIYIVNHAEDSYVFLDLTFVPLLEAVAEHLKPVKGYVVMTDEAHMPDTKLPDPICYESLIADRSEDFDWPEFDERTASSLCYTSGTTGNPKGVLYSHRSTLIHAFAACSADLLGLTCRDTVLPVVPMFHANAWAIPYAAPMTGAKLVFPGALMDGASVYALLDGERVTFSAGVPTVWLMLFDYLDQTGNRLPHLKSVVCGGSAVPPSMIRKFEIDYDTRMIHAWGMTETSPIGTIGTLKRNVAERPAEKRFAVQEKQGRGVYGAELRIVDEAGAELPRDGVAFGQLMIRGPWVADGYFKGEGGRVLDAEGWFPTGDVATLDPDGYMQIVDRTKDVIKSGGEWISSIDLENVAVGHPEVAEACVIGLPHPKWDERPLLVVVRTEGSALDKAGMLAFLDGRIAKWWTPDDVVFVDDLPHTPTGKLWKTKLRETFKDYVLPTASDAAE